MARTGDEGRHPCQPSHLRSPSGRAAALRLGAPLLLLVVASGCAAPRLRGAVFAKAEVRYRVGLPTLAPEGPWRSATLPGNDAAWAGPEGLVLAVNASCGSGDDAPLEVLTRHLLIGFTEREPVSSRLEPLDGREALRSGWAAKLDGVPVELELAVLKKNGCVHDFIAIAPRGQRTAAQEALSILLNGFAQEWRR